MEIECDLATIRDEDLLRKMWQQSEDFGRKKEIRSHLYKLRESRLREFYSTGGPGGDIIMNPSTDLCYGKTPLTPSHGDSLVDQSFQSLKTKEIRDSESPTREIKFRNSGGVAGGVLVPDTTGWNVQTSSEVSPDGRAFRTETLAKTDGIEKIPGGRSEFAGRNEQKSSASHQGDDKNFVKKAAESSKTHLQEKVVVGDENSGRTEMKSSSVTSSSKVVSSSQVISSGDPGFDMIPRSPQQDQQYQKIVSAANNTILRNEQQQQQYRRNEEMTSSNVSDTYHENKKYVDMDKASPEYQQHVQYLMSQPGAIVSNTVEYPKPGVKMITTVKKLPDGTTVRTKRYETEASADTSSISQTMKQQQQQRVSSSTTQKTTEKRTQDSENVFTRLAKTRDSSAPITPDTPTQDDIHSRLQKSRGEQKFSDTIDQRSTQIFRDTNAPSPRNGTTRRVSDSVDNVEMISTNKTVKKDLSQTVRNEKITSADFIQTERDRYVLDEDSPNRKAPEGAPDALRKITSGRYDRPQPKDVPINGVNSTGIVQQSSKSSAKFSESRRYSTETVESYHHSECHNESQDFTTHGFPSVRRPSEEPKGRSPSTGRSGQDFSTHGFPSVRSDKPTQEYPSERPSAHDNSTTERVHIVNTDRQKPRDSYPQSPDSTTRTNYSTNETRHVTASTDSFSTHGFPSVREGTPTRDSPKRPLGSDPAPGESPRRPSGQEPPASHVRKPPSDGFSTHGFPSVRAGTPTDDSPRRPSGPDTRNQSRKPSTDDFSTQGFPSVKTSHHTPTPDTSRTTNRRPPSVDRDDTVSVTSDRSNSVIYEKRIDAAHQAFARSLRCASPVDSIRRDSLTDRQTPRSFRNSYSPSKRDGRSPSHESLPNSESSRVSSGTVTKSSRTTTTDTRRATGPKSPVGKNAPNYVSNETIDLTLTRKITAKPKEKPTSGRPSTVNEQSQSAEPILRKKAFTATEDFLANEGVAVEPIIKKEKYYQLGPSDATLPSSRLNTRQSFGNTTPTTSRRRINTEDEVDTLIETSSKHTAIKTTPTKSGKTPDTNPMKPETLYSSKPKTKPDGYVSLNRATEITEKHNKTTNKQVSYPHYIPSAPKADRSSPHPERPQTSPSDKPTKYTSSPAPTTTSTTPHNAPKSITDKSKVGPSTSPTMKPSYPSSKVDNNTTRFTKTVQVDNAITRDTTTKTTRREPERDLESEPLRKPEDIDEGYVPEVKGRRQPQHKQPTSDDEGFEPDSSRAESPTSDFEYRRPTQEETYDEDDSLFKKTRKTDKKTVTHEFLNTERGGVIEPKRPQNYMPRLDNSQRQPQDSEPRRPEELKPLRSDSAPRRPEDSSYNYPEDSEPRRPENSEPWRPDDSETRRPSDSAPRRPEESSLNYPEDSKQRQRKESEPWRPDDSSQRGPDVSEPRRPSDSTPRRPEDCLPQRTEQAPSRTKPPLDRSETFEERCRQILGMEDETTTERTKRVQDFIDTERVIVDIKRKPAERSSSPEKRQPTDTVSIEDCDDDDAGVPRKYPSEKTTINTRTVKTTNDTSSRDRSPHKKPDPNDRSPLPRPTDETPWSNTPRSMRPTEETTITTTEHDVDRHSTTKDNRTHQTPDELIEPSPYGRSPKDKPRGDILLGKTTTVITKDITTAMSRPRDESPTVRTPTEYDSPSSPSREYPRDRSPIDKTFKTTRTSYRDTVVLDDRTIPLRSPNESPNRTRGPTEIDVTTETTTRVDQGNRPKSSRTPIEKPRTIPKETNSDKEHRPINQSPSNRLKGSRLIDEEDTDETYVQMTTKITTTEETDTDDHPRKRFPSSSSGDKFPSEKPRRPLRSREGSPTSESYPRDSSPSDGERSPRGRSPAEKQVNSPRGSSPQEKPKGRKPDDVNFGQTVVQSTAKRTQGTVTLKETDVRSKSPSRKLKLPKSTDRDIPSDEETDATLVEETLDSTISEFDSPKNRSREPSPAEKLKRRQPYETENTVVIITANTCRDETTKNRPRNTSPNDKPRRREPTDEEIDTTAHLRTTKTTRDKSTLEKTIDQSSKDHPRVKSPTEKSGPKSSPRDRSPTEKAGGPRTTEETTSTRTTKTTTGRTTVDERSPKDRPRELSPSDKPRRNEPTDEEIDTTVHERTSKTTRDKRILDETIDQSSKDRPRGKSPTEKPGHKTSPRDRSPTEKAGGPRTTEETTSTRTTKTTTGRTTVDERSPKDRPRELSPSDKPRRNKPTDEEIDTTVHERTFKTTRDKRVFEETIDQSSKDHPRGMSQPEKPGHKTSSRDRSPIEKARGPRPTEETTSTRTAKTTTGRTTVDERSPQDRPRELSPSDKPRRKEPTEEEIDTTVHQRTSKTTRDKSTFEETINQSSKDRPRGKSPTEKPVPKSSPRDRSPTEKHRGPRPSEETTTIVTTDRTTVDERSPKDRPRVLSPYDKPRMREPTDEEIDTRLIEKTTKTTRDKSTVEETIDRIPKDRPRGKSPTEKPSFKSSPRDGSPPEKPRGPRPTEETTTTRTTKTTTGRTTVEERSPKDRSRGLSPSDKPRKREPTNEEIDTTVHQRTSKTTRDESTFEETINQSSKDRPRGKSPTEKPGHKTSPRDRSPTEKARGSRPTEETTTTRTTKTTTGRTTVDERSPKDRLRELSPSDKPRKREPTDEEIDTTVHERTSKTTRDKRILEETIDQYCKDRPRGKSPTEKPGHKTSPRDRSPTEKARGSRPTEETTTTRTTKTTIGRTTVDERSPKDRPRELSPSDKPRRHEPTDEEIDTAVIQRTTKTTRNKNTLEETVDQSPNDRRREKSPTEKPVSKSSPRDRSPTQKLRGPRPTEEIIAIRTVKKSYDHTIVDASSPKHRPYGTTSPEEPSERRPSETDTDEETTQTSIENKYIERFSPKERPLGQPGYPSDTSPSQKPRKDENGDIDQIVTRKTVKTSKDQTYEDRYPVDRPERPASFPRKPQSTNQTLNQTTIKTTTSGGTSPVKSKDYLQSDEESDETFIQVEKIYTQDGVLVQQKETSYPSPSKKPGGYPRDRSPLDKQRRPKTSEVDETTVRSTTTRTSLQETDFEKRYPKGRPRAQSPDEKSTTRRPSKPSFSTTTTTTRNRIVVEPQTHPASRDKIPTKSTPHYPKSQPTTEKRIPAEVPSRKPKSSVGTTTKATSHTITTRVSATHPKAKEVSKTQTKLVTDSPIPARPGSRQPGRRHSPSISPDSSPSRPTSEVEHVSPYDSPNTSPSRKSPSPNRSIKLEDITSSVVTTNKTTVSLNKSKPKVTHITTAKFEVSPPTSPTKVTYPPEVKSLSQNKPIIKGPASKPVGSRQSIEKITTKKISTTRKDVIMPADSERDLEFPSDLEDIDSLSPQKTQPRKMPVMERKESAPVNRVTQVDKDIQRMSRSTSENVLKTSIIKRPTKQEPSTTSRPTSQTDVKTSPKTERRPSKHLSTKTINLTTFDKVINSEDMENVIIDIQQAKSSREPSPNKIVPTPVSEDVYTGKPRYPDVVQEPEDEPRKKPNVKNVPIFEEETNDFVGCQITEISEESFENTTKLQSKKLIEEESRRHQPNPLIVTGDNVDSECLLSVHDKVSKFISTAEEVSRPKTSAPFRRHVPEEEVPEDDECLLTVDEKVNKFIKTAENVTKEVKTSSPKRIERPRIDDLDEDLKTDECILSVSEKVNKFTTKAEKLGPSAPQRSPELVARIERQISKQSEGEPEIPRDTQKYPGATQDDDDSSSTVRKVKQTKSMFEREERKYTDRQIDILSRPSVWDKKPKTDVKLDDILNKKPEEESEPELEPDFEAEPEYESPRKKSLDKNLPEGRRPSKSIKDTVTKRKEIFENKISTQKATITNKPVTKSTESVKRRPADSPSRKVPADVSDSRYPNKPSPIYVDGYHPEPEDVHEGTYGSLKSRQTQENFQETTETNQYTIGSPIRKSSSPEARTSTKSPEYRSPSRRYSDDRSSRQSFDHYTETSTQKYPEDRSPDRRAPHEKTPSPTRNHPVGEPEDYTFSSTREETNKHHKTRTSYRSPKDAPLTQVSISDDDNFDHSPTRSIGTTSSQKHSSTHRTTSSRVTEDTTSRRPRRPSGNEPSTPTSTGRALKTRGVPETVAARRNIFEKSPGDVSPKPNQRRPSYMDHTKSSLEHTRRDSLEVTKTNYSRKSSMEDEPYEASPRGSVKFGVGLRHREEPKPKRKISSSDIANIEDIFDLEFLEEMLNIVTLYEQRRRIRAQIRVVKKLLETKTKEEVLRMTKITTLRKTSSSSVRESPLPRRDTPVYHDRYLPSDEMDSESVVESRHVEEREEIIKERSISPQMRTSKTVTKVTEIRKIGEPLTPKRPTQKKDEPKDSKPIWATKNILKKPSENEKVTRALSAKKTTSTTSSSTSRTQQTQRQRVATDEDCITSSYGIGPTDEDGRPLFGIRALKKKTTANNSVQPSETTKVTGSVITEKYYSENGAEPVGERKVTVYSSNPEDLLAMETQYDRGAIETVKLERLSKDGVSSVTKVQKIGNYKADETPAILDDPDFGKSTTKTVRRGSVKEMSEKFIRKESSSSVTEKSSGYPKAGLILRSRTNSGATADTADQYEVRAKSAEYDDESDNDCNVEIRTSRKHSHSKVTESEGETEIRRKTNTRSFLNSAGSKVTGVDDVLERMRNADNVVVDGDTLEDREARSLLNKFLGASVLMSGMESIIPQKDLSKTVAGGSTSRNQGVKTTRVTKTIKTATEGGSSSSPVARETCDFEEIWDEETLKELLEKSTSYEERRSIRARLRQLMAEREAPADKVASVNAQLSNDKKVKATTTTTTTTVVEKQPLDDESSGSEYEEIIEEYTASEDDEEEVITTKTAVVADKKKEEPKEEPKPKKIIEEIKKTTITKKEEPKQTKTIVVEKTTIVKKSTAPSNVEQSKSDANKDNKVKDNSSNNKNNDDNENDEDDSSASDTSKGESLLIPLLQGLLHKNMPQARPSKIIATSSAATTTTKPTTANQNSTNLKSSLKTNNTHLNSTSSNNTNSLGDSGLSSEVSRNNSSLGQQGGSTLRVTTQQIEDSGTESGEDLRLIAAGLRDSMKIEGIENQSDMSLIKEVTNALNRLESSLKEGKDLSLDSNKKNTLLALVERLQTGLTAPEKLASTVEEQDFPDETSSPEADNHRSNRQRFAKRRNRNNRHTVGVSKEELEDARRYMEEKVMIESLSSCTTPEANATTTPPQFFAIQKQYSTGAILSNHEPQEASSSLFRPNQFVPNNLKHSTEAGSKHPEVPMRQKKINSTTNQRQSSGDMNYISVGNHDANKRPLSDSYDSYQTQGSGRVTFSDTDQNQETFVQEKNQYNRYHHSDNQPEATSHTSTDSTRFSRFNSKKQLMKRANTIDIPKTHRYNAEFDTDSEIEDKNPFNPKGLRGTVQVNVKRKPRQVVPNFEPKTENDHKFLAFIQKQNATPGLGWNTSKSVSNWTNKFGNIKNVFESGAATSKSNALQKAAAPASSAKNFWKKTEEQQPPKISSNVLTSALKAKERNEQQQKRTVPEMVAPKPIHMNKFIHNPQSAFKPIENPSDPPAHVQFKPIPMDRPVNNTGQFSPTKAYNPVSSRRQALESPQYSQSSPTKSWVKQNTSTNSPVTLPWTVKPPENSVLKLAATKFETKPPLNAVQRHQSFKNQEPHKRASLPNASQPYQHHYDDYLQPSYMSNSQPISYPDYTPQRMVRESSLTNPQAAPLVLTPNKPAYSPLSLQPYDYYADGLSPNVQQTDMTDDDIDDMESMTEYRVEAKVMGKPISQQAVTVGTRTAHVSDDEVFGKNSRAAKSLLSVMKNIGNGTEKSSKKLERKTASSVSVSPDGRAYQAPIVEPLFPDIKFENNRLPEYIGPQPHQQQPTVEYHKNPAYVPLQDYERQAAPIPPPRGSQENRSFLPQERPNVYQPPRRDPPSNLPLQTVPIGLPSYNSSSVTPESVPLSAQIITDGMYMQSVPTYKQPYSVPITPEENATYQRMKAPQLQHPIHSQYEPTPDIYPIVVNLPQIPLETSYTKVYDKPRDVAPYYEPPVTFPSSPDYQNVSSQPAFAPPRNPQPSSKILPKLRESPQLPPQDYHPRAVPSPQYYQPTAGYQQAVVTYQTKTTDIPPQYYQSPTTHQSPVTAPQRGYQLSPEIPPQFYQPSKVPESPQQTMFASQPGNPYGTPKSQQPLSPPILAQKPHSTVLQHQAPKTHSSSQPLSPPYQPRPPSKSIQPKPQVPLKTENVIQSHNQYDSSAINRQHQNQRIEGQVNQSVSIKPPSLNKQTSLDGRRGIQMQSQVMQKVEEVRRKSLGNILESNRLEREARQEKAAAIRQDMYSVQQDLYSQKIKSEKKTTVRQQETKVYKSSAPDDTPDIVKSSLAKDDIPILKKFGPPQRHCYIPNAYQNPLMKSETTVVPKTSSKPTPRKFSDPAVSRGPVIVEIPATPQPGGEDEIPRNIVFNNVSAFTSMALRHGDTSMEYTSQQTRPNKLSKCDSWNQICQLQNAVKPPSPKYNNSGSALRRSKSGHTLALPKLYEASYDRSQISEKQKTVAAYFTGQKSPNSLSRNSSQTNLVEQSTVVAVKKSSINRVKTSEKASTSKQNPSSGLSRSHTMPHIAHVNLLDESNVEDAFEALMNGLSTTTTEKTETQQEDGGVVTRTTKVTTRTVTGASKPVSPFAKFQQLDKQSSLQSPKSPNTPTTPGGSSSTPIFRFTDPALNARAATVKDQLLQWCQSKTQEYENVQITNFSASWTDGLAFCALIHHFLPDAFDYSKLNPKQRRHNFELAFRVADEKAGIAPLLDVEDMVVMKRPDWKCVFTYVQSIYRRFRNCQ